ncbi:thioredoxin domain-containing protein [Thecamonas trahens ATCC 50062]|uniref:Thioredoxin domain-containing protein n=1 Tax=Thecamonas trahens ATCC 50062 TaxID=461836 RepID=A0A0L0DVU0_THETB|nr:thioredoxin domain-containing protein [Thecamonas trahens ATCC 50062]KNC56297.1 thioredoxin domain-containing protein [Thecamonas trahens ATCC 50062]|eukprot:XP_013760816.1 thioredoxin domain-containing protein [Thecamonas trahens ATCC 50062]
MSDADAGELLSDKSLTLVEFYAPWCHYCKELEPVLVALAKQDAPELRVAKIDCTRSATTCRAFGVRGYPTLFLVRGPRIIPYGGARSLSALHAWSQGADFAAAMPNPLPPPMPRLHALY